MQDWTITLSNGTKVTSNEVSTAHLTQVMELASSTAWADLDPTRSAKALMAWVAVLETVASDDKVLETHMQDVLLRSMSVLMSQLEFGV